ncbi:VanZ like protein [Stackebrandtia endophytica]|uniref:VanZ like protein n=1 Tax=Stackebrandtia endophytica TaxID=1496996 RepID=A0A543B100_9ACTN|nr:VanZ like protein [Stackebrandtia endophytica]
MAFFVPFGLYLGLLAPSRWWTSIGAIAGVSLTLEVGQYVLAVGSSDVTDLVANTVGGLSGIALIALARVKLRERTNPIMARVCAVGTVIGVLAVLAFVASPLRYAPPRDSAVAVTSCLTQLDGDRFEPHAARIGAMAADTMANSASIEAAESFSAWSARSSPFSTY